MKGRGRGRKGGQGREGRKGKRGRRTGEGEGSPGLSRDRVGNPRSADYRARGPLCKTTKGLEDIVSISKRALTDFQ